MLACPSLQPTSCAGELWTGETVFTAEGSGQSWQFGLVLVAAGSRAVNVSMGGGREYGGFYCRQATTSWDGSRGPALPPCSTPGMTS